MNMMDQNNDKPEEYFDFSKYAVKSTPNIQSYQPDQVQDTQNNIFTSEGLKEDIETESFNFDKYKIKQPPSMFDEFKRHAARTGSRVAESIIGFPGDFVGFVKYLSDKIPESPSFLKREPTFVQRYASKALEALPKSEELKEFSSYLTSGFTDPQSAKEELGDDITSLATVMINPSKAASSFPKFLKNIGSSILKSSAVKGSGQAAKALGATDDIQSKVELGTLFLTGLMGGKTADKFINEKYNKARSLIPKGYMINTSKLEKDLINLYSKLSRGISTPTKDEVKKAIDELRSKASKGTMEIDELVESVHNINERMNSKKLFDELNTSERKLLKNRYDLFKNEVNKEIAKYGQYNPDFYKEWKGANEGFATIAQSKKVSNFLQSKFGKIPKHLAGSVALDLFLGHPASIIPVSGGYTAVKAGELLYRIMKSPTLRDHYIKVLIEAGNENLTGAIKHINAIDKSLVNPDNNQDTSLQNVDKKIKK